MSTRHSFGRTVRFHLRYWPTRARVRVRQAVYTWRHAHVVTYTPPTPPAGFTLTADAVAAALVAAGLADYPDEVGIVRAPYYRGLRGWGVWVDLPCHWDADADPTGTDYFDRRDRFAVSLGVEPRRIMLHTYPGQPTRMAVSVFNRPVIDLMRDTAYADD